LADAGQGHRRRIERGKGTIGVGKFNPPEVKTEDRLADEPVKVIGGKWQIFIYSLGLSLTE
jgi:hypothetical protein